MPTKLNIQGCGSSSYGNARGVAGAIQADALRQWRQTVSCGNRLINVDDNETFVPDTCVDNYHPRESRESRPLIFSFQRLIYIDKHPTSSFQHL
jgi:hypothetical protein